MIQLGTRTELSLLDAAYKHSVDYYVVFRQFPRERSRLWKLLKSGFYHVECWGYVPPGAWLRFDTCLEFISVEVYAHPPWELIEPREKPTFVHYQGVIDHGKMRQRFFVGPITCVALTAAFLGIRLPFFCRTPYQFYKLLRRLNGPQVAKTAERG